jgi:CheY-like chemotaxis protein
LLHVHPPRGPVPKILIADDNTNIQKMVSLAFEERGIDVVSVGNGETAVRKLPDVNPDLVLADVFMPVRNGYEVCEFVKKDTRYSHVPVILLVGAFDPLDEREARRVGADGVLKKPFVPPDPLIAMVMSALERNPKVAAELAKAKEVIREPEPVPEALENPAQKAPTPLPDFPEPTAEEAAQIYGFGKGVRTLDEAEEESAKSAPKKPAAEEEAEEQFDSSSTSRDWHRKRSMDLDIPDDIAAKPAFSMEQDLSPISFPSERDVPPRKVRTHDVEEEPIEIAKPHLELPLEEKAETKQDEPAASTYSAPVAGAKKTFEAPSEIEPKSEPVAASASTVSVSPSEPVEVAATPATQTSVAVAPPAGKHIPSAHEPEPAATSSHWMDLMSPAPTPSYGSGSWLDALSPKQVETTAPAVTEGKNSAAAPAAVEASEEAAAVQEPATEEIRYDSSPAAAEAETIQSFEHRKPSEEPRTFARELDRGGFSYHLPSDEPAHEAPKSSYVEESPVEAASPSSEVPAPTEPAAQPDSSFFAPESTRVAEPEPSAEPVAAAHEFAAETTVAETVSQFFSAASQDSIERIPTAPPPNREALAGIPFLQPPKEITEPVNVTPSASEAAPAVDVDSVVQRVIEKLGPQLQEMLAQGLLKPLVENLLQQELAKKK